MSVFSKSALTAICVSLAGMVAAQDDHRPPKPVPSGTYDVGPHMARDGIILGASGNMFFPLKMLGDDYVVRHCRRRFFVQDGAILRKCNRTAYKVSADEVLYVLPGR